MAGKFELYTDKRGNYRFRLKAGNGQVIATGEDYPTRAAALKGIESIRKNAAEATLVDQTQDAGVPKPTAPVTPAEPTPAGAGADG
ncbi:MAG TPA: YegP family protein [Segeticoccus sp.]|uniref:YegP family protein n=1 Tax=Segeticoccus sp. TaxID=2706531 RepID=UPI002D8022B1|nr:YegP family protein [Segeticoccus sp.]HET8600877.1 YegP family protein [Segeticoccus sp.]